MSGRDLEGGVSSEPNPRVAGGGGYPNISATYSATVTLAKQWTPWVVPMFVAANVVMFVITMFVNNCPKNNDHLQGSCVLKFLGRLSFEPLGVNSFLGPSSFTLGKMGALEWYNVVHGRQGWRLITCIWLHAGVAHLLANMLILDLLGIRLERQFGFARVGLIYILSGFGGSVLSSLFNRTIISVGASGALFGLLGAMLSDLISNWTIYTYKGAAIIELLLNFVMNLALGILPHVDNFAHIGGFLTGFLLGFVLLVRPQFGWVECRYCSADAHVKSKYKPYQYILWLIAVILLIVGLSMGLVMLFRGVNGNDRCSWCHYLSCVPTSKWKCDN